MSQFQRRYSDRVKRAVGLAQIDGGKTAQQALDALHAGQLVDVDGPVPAPADRMPKSTAHDCARKIRLEREGRRGGLESKEPQQARAELTRRLVVAADRLTRRVERKSNTGTGDAQLAELLTKAARAVREVCAAQRAADDTPTPSRPPSPTGTGNGKQDAPASGADPSPLAAIAASIERADRTPPTTTQP